MKPVDLSVLIDSGIDVDDKDMRGVYYDPPHFSTDLYIERRCKPRMNYWFAGANFDNPREFIRTLRASGLTVFHGGGDYPIFKITGLQDGYCWPWEIEE